MQAIFSCGLALLLFFKSCSKPDLKEKVLKMKDMSELATSEFTFSKVIKASDDQTWYKFGGRKILFTCEAIVKAGVDISQLKAEDVSVAEDGKVTLRMPKAKIILTNIDPAKIKEVYRDVSFSRNDFSTEEIDGLLRQAQMNIDSTVQHSGILEDAEKNAKDIIGSWLTQNGMSNHEIILN